MSLPIILASLACASALVAIPIALMLAPKGGLSGHVAKDLITVGATSTERMLNRLFFGVAAALALCSLGAFALA